VVINHTSDERFLKSYRFFNLGRTTRGQEMKNLAALLAPRPAAEQKSHQTDEICTRPKPRAGTERGTKPDRRKRRRNLTRNSKTEVGIDARKRRMKNEKKNKSLWQEPSHETKQRAGRRNLVRGKIWASTNTKNTARIQQNQEEGPNST
jgi:hypothetical protein